MSSQKWATNWTEARAFWTRKERLIDQTGVDQWVHPSDIIDAAEAERLLPSDHERHRQVIDLLLALLPDRDRAVEMSRRMVRFAAVIERLLPNSGYTTAFQTARKFRLHPRVVGEEKAFVDSLLQLEKQPGPFCLPAPVEVPRDASALSCVANSKLTYPLTKPNGQPGELLRLPTEPTSGGESVTSVAQETLRPSSLEGLNMEKIPPLNTTTTASEEKRAA